MPTQKEAKAARTTAAAEPVPYSVGKWDVYDNYQCGLCPFAHLDRDALEKHARAFHNRPLSDQPSAAPNPSTPGGEV